MPGIGFVATRQRMGDNGSVVEWIAIGVAAAAAYFAWRANHKSDDANQIARRALEITEAEHQQMQRERVARARLVVSASVVGYEPGDDGVIRLGGSHATLRIAVVIRNEGDRDAGRGHVEVTLPLSMSDQQARWTDLGGRESPEFPQRAGRVGDVNVITRPLEAVARDVPERMWLTVPATVPQQDAVNDYPIRVQVAAEGVEQTQHEFMLRVGRDASM